MHSPLGIHRQDGGGDLGRNALHLAADQGHQLVQGQLVDHALQHMRLQHLVHFGVRDVGQDRDAAPRAARAFVGRIDDQRHPAGLPRLAVQQGVSMKTALRQHIAPDALEQVRVRVGAQQDLTQQLAQHLSGLVAKQACKPFVDIHHTLGAVGHHHGVVAGIQRPAKGRVRQGGSQKGAGRRCWTRRGGREGGHVDPRNRWLHANKRSGACQARYVLPVPRRHAPDIQSVGTLTRRNMAAVRGGAPQQIGVAARGSPGSSGIIPPHERQHHRYPIRSHQLW